MKKFTSLIVAALVAAGFLSYIGAQQSGSGIPGGSTYSTQYKSNSTTFGGAGPGAAGTVLTSNGAAAAPTFQAASGGVTSIDAAGTGIFGFTGGPVTTTGTLTLTQTGTSGGIPYFSGAGTLSSSGALTANRLVLGGGAATTPSVLGSLGTTTTLLHGNAAGAPTFGAVGLTTDVTGTLPFGNGGTGLSSASDDTVMVSSGSAWVASAVPNCTDTGGNHLNYTTSTNAFSCGTSGGGGGATFASGSFTATFDNACTTSPTATVGYTLVNAGGATGTVTLSIPALTNCTSDSSSYTSNAGDMPASIRPTSGPKLIGVTGGTDSGTGTTPSCIIVTTGGSVSFSIASNGACITGTTWTSSGTKNGNSRISSGTYTLD